jgi:hypothetical protein
LKIKKILALSVVGLSSEAEAALDKALKVQQELDEKRGAYAERLRAVRGAANSQKSSKKREKRIEGNTQRDSGHSRGNYFSKVL